MRAASLVLVALATAGTQAYAQKLGGTSADFAAQQLAPKWPPVGGRPAITEQEAQQAHARGQCGTLGPGIGLGADGRGWIVSMLPGRHEFRVAGGTVGITVQRLPAADFDIGRPYYIVVDAPPGAVLEWRMVGHDWGPVAKAFLYPASTALNRNQGRQAERR